MKRIVSQCLSPMLELLESRTMLSALPVPVLQQPDFGRSNTPNINVSLSHVNVKVVNVPVKVVSMSVETSTHSLVQHGSLTGDGSITATGQGSLHYYWVVQYPNGKISKVGGTYTVKVLNNTVPIHTFVSLPNTTMGNYSAWIRTTNAGNVMESNVVHYTVNEIPLGISITYTPPQYVWGVRIKGTVVGTFRNNYKVVVLINVYGGWWTKPYWDKPVTKFNSNGKWSCAVTTGGSDSSAEEYRAYLIPKSMDAPLAYGDSIPSELAPYVFAVNWPSPWWLNY